MHFINGPLPKIIISCIFLSVGACAPSITEVAEYPVGDGGLLSNIPCGPPCFWNIIPGITTKDQALGILREKGIFQQCKYFDTSNEGGTRGYSCNAAVLILLEKQDIVSGIGFTPSEKITVSEVYRKFGAPDGVSVVGLGLPESKPRSSMTLYYDRWFVKLNLPEQASNAYDLASNIKVESISYFDKLSYETIRQYASGWAGFGTYHPHSP